MSNRNVIAGNFAERAKHTATFASISKVTSAAATLVPAVVAGVASLTTDFSEATAASLVPGQYQLISPKVASNGTIEELWGSSMNAAGLDISDLHVFELNSFTNGYREMYPSETITIGGSVKVSVTNGSVFLAENPYSLDFLPTERSGCIDNRQCYSVTFTNEASPNHTYVNLGIPFDYDIRLGDIRITSNDENDCNETNPDVDCSFILGTTNGLLSNSSPSGLRIDTGANFRIKENHMIEGGQGITVILAPSDPQREVTFHIPVPEGIDLMCPPGETYKID